MKNFLISALILIGTCNQVQAQKHELFVLSVGVSNYKDNTIPALKFAHKDASDLAEAWKKQTDLFDVRKVSLLTDKTATRENIRNEFAAMKRLITSNDLFVFIFSGHGTDAENLVTYDYDKKDINGSSLTNDELKRLFKDNINCSYIILIDACYSQNFLAKDLDGKNIESANKKAQEIALKNLSDALTAKDKASIIIVSSASDKKSFECQKCQNGFFVQSILDAFDGKVIADKELNTQYYPDYNKTGFIYPHNLVDYLKEDVALYTRSFDDKQQVWATVTIGRDFPLIKLPDADSDGVADIHDGCPAIKGTANGCPDNDNDGIANKDDKCPDEKGDLSNSGCSGILPPAVNESILPPSPVKISKSNAIAKSLVFPGWGDKAYNPKSKKIVLGFLSYGSLIGGFLMQSKSKQFHNSYNVGLKQSEITHNRSQTNKYNTISTILWGVSAIAWTIDLTTIAAKKPAKLTASATGLSLNFNIK